MLTLLLTVLMVLTGALPTAEASTEPTAWVVPHGQEFWRRSAAAPALDAVDRVRHAFGPNVAVCARTYRAEVLAETVHLLPGAAACDSSEPHRLSLRTRAVRRGGDPLFTGTVHPLQLHVVGNTAQVLLEPESGLIQHIEARGDGVELTWVLANPPSGEGPLEVEVEATGLVASHRTPSGLHFVDDGGTARARLGPAVVVDASGTRWEVRVSVRSGRLHLEVPASVLDSARYPLALDPVLSPELGTDTPIVDLSTHFPEAPAVAAGSDGFLVVWTELFGEQDVRAARLDGDGMLLDPTGITVFTTAQGSNVVDTPRVAFNGTDFLVVWSHGDMLADTRIKAARVASDGSVLDDPAIEVRGLAGSSGTSPSVASDGTGWLVAWQDDRNAATGDDVYALRIGANGVPLDASAMPISLASGDQTDPAVASNGTDYLVAWSDPRGGGDSVLYGARLQGDGTLLDGPADGDEGALLIGGGGGAERFAAVASDGTDYLVVWEDERNATTDLFGARVEAATGQVVESGGGFAISTASGDQTDVAVACNGTEYLVTWIDQRPGSADHVVAARVLAEDGSVPDGTDDAGGFVVSGGPAVTGLGMGVAALADDFLVAWEDGRHADSGVVYGARVLAADWSVEPPETVTDPGGFPISFSANAQQYPAVASTGDVILVVWEDRRNLTTTDLDIYGVRLDPADGTVLDPDGIAISTATGNQTTPAVAASADGFLVAWADTRADGVNFDLFGARVDRANGAVIDGIDDAGGIPICEQPDTQSKPSVASDGTDFLVAWVDARNRSTTGADIYATRVSGDPLDIGAAAVLDGSTGLRLSDDTAYENSPAVAAGAGRYLVAWEDYRNGASYRLDLYGNFVEAIDGTVSHPPSAPMSDGGFAIIYQSDAQYRPSVAFDGTRFLVAWEDERDKATSGFDIYATRISTSGSNLDGYLPVQQKGGDQSFARVAAADGGDFLVTWLEPAYDGHDLLGARVVGATGEVRDGPPTDRGFLVAERVYAQALALSGPRQAIAVYRRTVEGAYRIHGRLIDLNEPPVAIAAEVAGSEDTPLPILLAGVDPDGDALQFTISTEPSVGSLSPVETDGSVTYTPAPEWSGTESFAFEVSDATATSDPALVQVTIAAVNDWPEWVSPTPSGIVMAAEGNLASFRVVAEDVDGPSLSVDVTGLPTGAAFALDPSVTDAGTFTWTPTWEDGGPHMLTLSADDTVQTVQRFITLDVHVIDDDLDGLPDTWESLHGLDPGRDDTMEDLDNDGQSNGSEWLLGTDPDVSNAPSIPALSAPVDESRLDTARPTLSWAASTDPEGDPITYSVEVAPTDDPNTSVFSRVGLTSLEVDLDLDLDEDRDYQWTAWATDGVFRSPDASIRVFRVDAINVAPAAPTLVAPPDLGTVATATPRLQCNRVVDPDEEPVTYRFVVGRLGDPDVEYASAELTDPGEGGGPLTYDLPEALEDGSSWWWDAIATDARGASSDRSGHFSFAVDLGNQPPPAPVLLSPVGGEVVTDNPPTLRVETVADPEGAGVTYRIALSPDDTFAPDTTLVFDGLASDGTELSFDVPVRLVAGDWFWEVVASDGVAASTPGRATFTLRTPEVAEGTCGCGSTSTSPTWVLLLLAVVGVRRRTATDYGGDPSLEACRR
jgi:hypothetical protein